MSHKLMARLMVLHGWEFCVAHSPDLPNVKDLMKDARRFARNANMMIGQCTLPNYRIYFVWESDTVALAWAHHQVTQRDRHEVVIAGPPKRGSAAR